MTSQLFHNPPSADIVGYCLVAVEQGVDAGGGLTYAIPPALADVQVGQRVIVPLGRGNKPTAGTIIQRLDQSELPRVKPIVGLDPHQVSLPEDLVQLACWMAGYYCCPLGMVIANMLPAAVKRGTGSVVQTVIDLTDLRAPEGLVGSEGTEGSGDPGGAVKLTALQKRVLQVAWELSQAGQTQVEIKSLADQAGAKSVSSVRQLIDKGVFVSSKRASIRSSWQSPQVTQPPPRFTLTQDQQQAVERLTDGTSAGFGVHLLHGVTGSGKTEVYLRLIEHVLKQSDKAGEDGGIVVLVPEIALTPQTVARFVGRFDRVAVLHSGLTAAQRHDHWRRIRDGEARIVVGARSAVFAPLANLRLIIVDEEHESSYKQDQLPRYHARDVAIKRGQLCDIPVVLGSATPSLESYCNAVQRQRYQLLRLPTRAAGMKLPKVQIVDMQQQRRKGVHLLSPPLEQALSQTLGQGGQAILLLNRRGYANYIACPDHTCGWLKMCEHCDATMVYHKDQALPTGGVVRCHHCTAEVLLNRLCPLCSKKVTVFGLGVQRVEEELARKLPNARLARMDSDLMRTGKDYFHTLEQFRQGQIDVLVGTQMIAKGLDFPNVRLVGVISGDTSLHMPDFRAAERTFQLIAQVAGRAGRSTEQPGRVIVQSFNPSDPAIVLAAEHDYESFAQRELELRQEMRLPPFARMARIVVRDRDHLACVDQARKLADQLAAVNQQMGQPVRLHGPAPCPIARVAEFHRQQIELLADQAAVIQKLLTHLRNARQLVSDARTAVDVDPVTLL